MFQRMSMRDAIIPKHQIQNAPSRTRNLGEIANATGASSARKICGTGHSHCHVILIVLQQSALVFAPRMLGKIIAKTNRKPRSVMEGRI
jgi:hypothetical protein